MSNLDRKIKDARKQKRLTQASLEKSTKLHAPKGARKILHRLRDRLRKLLGHFTDRIKALRKRKQDRHDRTRKLVLEYCRWGYANEPSIHYAQSRPIDGLTSKDYKKLPKYTDCSGFATLAYAYAGAPDPNGYGFNGYGFTGTMYQSCKHIPQSQAKAGDLVEFGGYPGSHVVVLIEDGSKADPMCMSHGQESGPRPYPLSVQKSAHAGQTVTFLKAIND